jgi:hypothetical protein
MDLVCTMHQNVRSTVKMWSENLTEDIDIGGRVIFKWTINRVGVCEMQSDLLMMDIKTPETC